MKRVGVVAVLVTLAVAGCSTEPQGHDTDPGQVDAVEPPAVGACRALTADDVREPANATVTVDCVERHTAETYAVVELDEQYADLAHDDALVGRAAHQRCGKKFHQHLAATESQALRTTLGWVWFRPSQRAWAEGARWIRCDVIGGHPSGESLRALPTTTEGLFVGRPEDRWLVCASGSVFEDAEKVPCAQDHDWRAVSTVKVGEPDEPWPGDEAVATISDQFCESSVEAWLNYPEDFEFAITWFGEAEWQAGNRLSVCWAGTTE